MNIRNIQFKKTLAYIAKPFNVGPIAFATAGTAKTVKDYIDEPKESKNRVLIKDASMLLGSVAAFALVSPLSQYLCKASFFNKLTKPIVKAFKHFCHKEIKEGKIINGTKLVMEHTEHITNQAIAATINTLAGILGAVSANELMNKYVFSKKSFIKEPVVENLEENAQIAEEENETDIVEPDLSKLSEKEKAEFEETQKKGYFKKTKVFEKFDYATPKVVKKASNRIWCTVSDVPEMRVLSAPMIALTGFSVANTEGYKNKIKKTSYELIANTFIPTAVVTAVSIAVEKKRGWIKYPALFAGLLVGSIAGHYSANSVNKHIKENNASLIAQEKAPEQEKSASV